MCGIAGIFLREQGAVSRESLEAMNALQAHRGPDGHDVFLDGPVGLAHRRLAILDLSQAGAQPLTIEGCTIVYNGEVYNFRELASELQGHGHRFTSDCDTEVLLRAYLQWGKACVERFNGMFALAIWDARQQLLFCARDRMGVKPFFFVEDGEGFEFASEIKTLLHKPERRKPRLRTLVRFLGEGLTDDEWETFFEPISVLPPAHTMIVSRGRLVRERYWRVDPTRSWPEVMEKAALAPRDFPAHASRRVDEAYFPEVAGLEEAAEAFRALLQDSVRLRLRSDVPVGTCLSGGLDSSSVVACAASLMDRPLETFSSIYPDRGYDEKRFIDEVVREYNTVANPVEPTGEDLPEIFERLVWHQDEPTGGPGLYSQWKVMEKAKEKVTVLLDGQGGDELLAGYHHYFREYLFELAKSLHAKRSPLDEVFIQAGIISEVTGHDHTEIAARAVRRAQRPKILKLFARERPGKVKTPALFNRSLASRLTRGDATRMDVDRLFSNGLSQKLHDDLTRFSIPALLRYEDRTSMAFSLEARVPFLDYRLVEFCFAMPSEFKIAPPLTKLVMRKAMNGRLPASVVQRMDKLGYPTPLANWFRQHLKSWVDDTFASASFRHSDLLDSAACHAVWADHQAGADRSWELWRILHVHRWSELFLQGHGFAQPARRG